MGRISNIFQRRRTPEPDERRNTSDPDDPSTSAHSNLDFLKQSPALLPLPSELVRHNSGVAAAVQERLAKEVLRKLQLATDAEEKEDRDIVCSEVFADITGELNTAARESTGTIYDRWYEALAPYFCRAPEASEAVLQVCRQLWGQPFTAPIFALLLHQWLLIHPEAGGADQRLKHLNILLSGARQLFLGDLETGSAAFQSLFSFIAEQIVLAIPRTRLDSMPGPAREGILSLTAAFLPFYLPANELVRALRDFPPLSAPAPEAAPIIGEGADFVVDRVVEMLAREVRAEPAMLQYLQAVTAMKDSPWLKNIRTSTRVRLQGELYSLTQSGGPRYASRAVNKLAFSALDALFPHGRRTRRLINLAFRFLHPQEWPWVWWDTYGAVLRAAVAWAVAAWFAVVAACSQTVARITSGVTRQRRH